jgi:ribosome-interacting GTPase 1
MRTGATVQDVCEAIHKDMVTRFKYALVWGLSVKHSPQCVGLTHLIQDEDVVEIHTS